MRIGKAVTAGLIGAVAMTVITWMGRIFMGMPVNMEMMLGTMFGLPPAMAAWVIGFAMHLMAGAVFALIYAAIFEYVTHRAGWGIGAGIGVGHTIFSGFMMGAVPMMHPLIPEQMPAPGMFMVNVPMGVIAFFMLHIIYGAIVGGMYSSSIEKKEIR